MTSFLTVNDIRRLFLDYFREKQHTVVPSSSLIPDNDPTLLFTNAGMVQFKDVFLGKEQRSYQRAVSSQRCVRAGGKHNDLDNVGYTARHHTFFEMLGNFSFGDYFKRDAIHFAWEFLTHVLKIPKEKLWVTVFSDDDEAADIWIRDIHIDPARVIRCGEASNFWSMGPTGPCGPCSEIFYDHGADIWGGLPGSAEEDGDRYVEIWNLVFMQHDRATDGRLSPLPKQSIDTGSGLERLSAVMQGVHNNYDIDLFQIIIKVIAKLADVSDLTNASLRVIADHIRSCSFLIVDGVQPSNEGRGYVLRRIIRRALRHGHKLGLTQPFFHQLVAPLAEAMGDAYPALQEMGLHIETVLRREEEQFSATLSTGLKLFEQAIENLSGSIIPGKIVFKLYDTYGFPADLTADMARERDLTVDQAGFERSMEEQRQRSRQSSTFTAADGIDAYLSGPSEFTGYDTLTENDSRITAIFVDNQSVESLSTGQTGLVILDRTPFYAESGGQVGDTGALHTNNAFFRVNDTQKQGQAIAHSGTCETGSLNIGDIFSATVDSARRSATLLNHTATHLLHHVLRDILGPHVIQKGSLVNPERLRFDFSHTTPLTALEIESIEQRVNQCIRDNTISIIKTTTQADAIKEGAMALFGEKYGDEVRVVRFGDSVELCGGTHAAHTGNIGLFKIISESGVAAGIRRIEAVTGEGAMQWLKARDAASQQQLKTAIDATRLLEKEAGTLKEKLARALCNELSVNATEMSGVHMLTQTLLQVETAIMRSTIDHLKNKLNKAVIVLASIQDNKVSVIAGVTANCTAHIKAGDIIKMIAPQIGGKGGGRPDLAEAGGTQPENIDQALQSVHAWVKEKLITLPATRDSAT